jgi:uncharacterized membrane protein
VLVHVCRFFRHIVAAITLGHIITTVTLDTIVAFVITLVALLMPTPVRWREEHHLEYSKEYMYLSIIVYLLFFLDVLNCAFSCSVHTASNERIISQQLIGMDMEGSTIT